MAASSSSFNPKNWETLFDRQEICFTEDNLEIEIDPTSQSTRVFMKVLGNKVEVGTVPDVNFVWGFQSGHTIASPTGWAMRSVVTVDEDSYRIIVDLCRDKGLIANRNSVLTRINDKINHLTSKVAEIRLQLRDGDPVKDVEMRRPLIQKRCASENKIVKLQKYRAGIFTCGSFADFINPNFTGRNEMPTESAPSALIIPHSTKIEFDPDNKRLREFQGVMQIYETFKTSASENKHAGSSPVFFLKVIREVGDDGMETLRFRPTVLTADGLNSDAIHSLHKEAGSSPVENGENYIYAIDEIVQLLEGQNLSRTEWESLYPLWQDVCIVPKQLQVFALVDKLESDLGTFNNYSDQTRAPQNRKVQKMHYFADRRDVNLTLMRQRIADLKKLVELYSALGQADNEQNAKNDLQHQEETIQRYMK